MTISEMILDEILEKQEKDKLLLEKLTKSEKQILSLLGSGKSVKEIAFGRNVEVSTTSHQINHLITNKYNSVFPKVSGRQVTPTLIRFALRTGLSQL